MPDVITIDCHYMGTPRTTAAYLLREGDRAAFVETNTNQAVPRLLEALRDEGLTPAQVEYVIVTHVHLDHAGGASMLLEHCPHATLLAHPRAAKHLVDPSKLVESAQRVYGEARFAELYGTIAPAPEARVRTLGDGESLTWGSRTLTFLHTRGHANHHFCIHDSGTNAIFTGDAFGLVYPDLQSGGSFAIPSTSPTDFDAAAAKQSLDRIVASGAERVYPTHFGGHGELQAIASQLHTQLDAYGAIVGEAFESVPDDALDGFCRARVRGIFDRLLEERGFGGDAAARQLLALDEDLNAQGVAFAVRKRRKKAER